MLDIKYEIIRNLKKDRKYVLEDVKRVMWHFYKSVYMSNIPVLSYFFFSPMNGVKGS